LAKFIGSISHRPPPPIGTLFGPEKHSLVIRLHAWAKVKVGIGGVDTEVASTIGVRQGSCEGPPLFLFIIQAAMETFEWPEDIEKPEFRFRENGKTTGRTGTGSAARRLSGSGNRCLRMVALSFSTRART
jgi:hypothetical protein